MLHFTEKDELRFWKKINKSGPVPAHVRHLGPCWVWTDCLNRGTGYGSFWHINTMKLAHRISWELHHGPIAEGLFVLHKCDHPPCSNPLHLFLGTNSDNAKDRKAKGRNADFRGEKSGMAKLTDKDVIEIRAAAAYLKMVQAQCSAEALAKKYKVKPVNIWHVISGLTWKHIPLTPNKLALAELERRLERQTT